MNTEKRVRKTHEDGPRGGRPFIGLRLKASGVAWLDKVADETGTTRAAVMRTAIALARANEKDLKKMLKEQV